MALAGIKVIEIAGLAPAPFCGMLLSDFGANVIRLDRPGAPPIDDLTRGKRCMMVNLKNHLGKGIIEKLCSNADVLIEPFRPGVMERLDLGPDRLMALNKRLVYARLSGFGQNGPYSKRAGHDINYLALSGVLSMFTNNGKPVAPINMLADFAGGGLMCSVGILLALVERSKSDQGQVVDVSMVEGTRYLSTYLWHTRRQTSVTRQFLWPNQSRKESNLLDSGAHFYSLYKTRDGRWISVGAVEPKFYDRVLTALNLQHDDFPQFDVPRWHVFKEKFAQIFAQKDLSEWVTLFRDTDACVEPVLELDEAEKEAKHLSGESFNEDSTPRPAPLLSRTPADPAMIYPDYNEHTAVILKEHGYSDREIVDLAKAGVIECKLETKL